ncbi:hypothetical protein ACS0TY_031000 [Phlomoides rotata]
MSACPSSHSRCTFLTEGVEEVPHEGPPVYNDEEQAQDVHLMDDEGPLLVLQRSCLMPNFSNDTVQRHHLFQLMCTINCKICKFIIDSGSCENVVSIDDVNK